MRNEIGGGRGAEVTLSVEAEGAGAAMLGDFAFEDGDEEAADLFRDATGGVKAAVGAGGGEVEFDGFVAVAAAFEINFTGGGEGAPGELAGGAEGADVFTDGGGGVVARDGEAAVAEEEHGGEERDADEGGEGGDDEGIGRRGVGAFGGDDEGVGGDGDPDEDEGRGEPGLSGGGDGDAEAGGAGGVSCAGGRSKWIGGARRGHPMGRIARRVCESGANVAGFAGSSRLGEKEANMAKYGLCIGINDYPGTGSDLAGCVNDANDWGAALTARGFTVKKLLNSQATGKGMRDAMKAAVAQAKSGDLVVIQYSGHGSFVPDVDGDEPDGTDECLCPHDIETKGPITDDELFELFSDRAPGSKVVMISDSCHSGTVARFAPITTPATIAGRGAPQRKVRFLPPGVFLSARESAKLGVRRSTRVSSPPGRYASLLLSGCQDTEYSYDAYFQGRPNGAFTFVALRELANLTASATYKKWHAKIRAALPSQQYPQSPNLYGSSSMKGWKVFV